MRKRDLFYLLYKNFGYSALILHFMHLSGHTDLPPPSPALYAPWQPSESDIRPEVASYLMALTKAIRDELQWYADKDEEAIKDAKTKQCRLVHSIEEPKITESELEKFLSTLEDNTLLKETIRMLYGNRQKLIESIKRYQAEVDALMTSWDPELERFLSIACTKRNWAVDTSSAELQAKMSKARQNTRLIVGPGSLYPLDNILTTPHSPPSLELWEHWVLLHTPEEAPLPPVKWNRLWSSLWQLLRRFI